MWNDRRQMLKLRYSMMIVVKQSFMSEVYYEPTNDQRANYDGNLQIHTLEYNVIHTYWKFRLRRSKKLFLLKFREGLEQVMFMKTQYIYKLSTIPHHQTTESLAENFIYPIQETLTATAPNLYIVIIRKTALTVRLNKCYDLVRIKLLLYIICLQ